MGDWHRPPHSPAAERSRSLTAGLREAVRGELRRGRKQEVLEGLAADDRIVIHPDPALVDGARVASLTE